MKHERFISWCLSTPWALMPERMAAYAVVLANAAAGNAAEPQAARPARTGGARSGAIAVIPVYGPIFERSSQIGMCEEGTSAQAIHNALADANADDSVSQILMDFSTPGGSVYGVQEVSAEIARSKKPVIGIANSLAASAGYWMLSQCSEAYITPGGEVGSIGVWTAHQDVSKALEDAGIKITLISAGEFKVEGNPYAPLGEQAQAFMQSRIDDYYGAFTRAVARGRKVSVDQVRSDMGKGRVFGADQAKASGMVDGIATFDQVVANMQKSIKASTPRASRLASAQRDIAIMG
ncbi:signal peptide peptidase SppA [Dyella jiangningensis]|uniref:S49 family peptidase n=1 Tax=Dyella sp. AtDHG13 TaxID=1938897 RepID=UPI000887BF55|nr:S49 family peptidase [Dyella sp. AtDHG13]PXV60667.1 signal peptide peptidase SppA [Dyella sp. AtDHG13]SDJ54396.1 signal peptide peptidase SppA [Dyella jiangningensis]